jgi:hypothetical protein
MSPQILQYKGISVRIPTNDHLPIHIHAYYSGQDYGMKVELYFVNSKLSKIVFKKIKGCKEFSPAQINNTKDLIDKYQQFILECWISIIVKKEKVKSKTVK